MKIDKRNLSKMSQAVSIVWHKLCANNPAITPEPEKLTDGDLQYLWFKTWMSIAYDDSNPNVMRLANGKRLLPYEPDFPLYPCNTSDSHVLTAMRHIAKTLASEAKSIIDHMPEVSGAADTSTNGHTWMGNGFCRYCPNVHRTDGNARSTCSDGFTCKGNDSK